VAEPWVTAVTVPFDTVTTASSDELHDTVWPDIGAPVWSFTVAVSVVVSPREVRVTAEFDRVIEVGTGDGG
tara:strand:- start:23 stop:235 length:213 start_codon:yes stop_codon:yes gene_type:complete